ncbi:MAG: hypothetical protein JRG71_13070, partial [Deltaproteobacteria bacterium]|nr:hypothetical protein [Deltaproteobacteria bacterium]
REGASRLDSWSVDVDEDKSVNLVNNTWGGNVGTVDIDRIKRVFDQNVAKDANQAIHKQIIELYEAERKRGNHWIDLSFPFGNLKEVMRLENDTWRQWVDPVLSGGLAGRQHLVFCQGFYEQLCAALLDYEPETGIELYTAISENSLTRIIDSDTGIRSLFFHLFSAKDSPPVAVVRRKYFDECNTDNDLLEIVLLAELCGKNAWLSGIISEMLDSDRDYDKARGLKLMGFSSDEDSEGRLREWIDVHGRSWVMDVARSALRTHQRNIGAKTWLERFATIENRVDSWATFRLFLQCVDRRYWVWEKSFVDTYLLSDWKRDAVSGNRGSIKDAIKENEKKLKDEFVGHKVKKDQLWPWMKKYLSN